MSRERLVAPGVLQHAFASDTLPPFDATWVTIVHDGGRAVVIDPGFRDPADADTLLAWAARHDVGDIDRILLTHTHRDHVAGLAALAARLGDPPVHVHPLEAERVPGDVNVVPTSGDRTLVLGEATIRTMHTPGHAVGHVAFEVSRGSGEPVGIVAGDLLTGTGGSWVGLPEGDVRAYLDSVRRVQARVPTWLAVAHGPAIDDPRAALDAVITHREARERALLDATERPRRLDDLLDVVYGTVPERVRPWVRAALLSNLAPLLLERKVQLLGSDEDGPYQRTAHDGGAVSTQH